jgi:hypothetical protein
LQHMLDLQFGSAKQYLDAHHKIFCS